MLAAGSGAMRRSGRLGDLPHCWRSLLVPATRYVQARAEQGALPNRRVKRGKPKKREFAWLLFRSPGLRSGRPSLRFFKWRQTRARWSEGPGT